jgi:hypothetical protein
LIDALPKLSRKATPVLICIALVGSGLAACGSDDKTASNVDPSGRSGSVSNIVTPGEISAQPAGSPQRALLSWFAAVQFKDYEGVSEFFAPEALKRISPARLRRDVNLVAPALGHPLVVESRPNGDKTVLRVLVQSFAAGTKGPTSNTPQTFVMVKDGNDWKLADPNYLTGSAAQIKQSEKASP